MLVEKSSELAQFELTHKKPPRRRFIASRENLRQMGGFGWVGWRHLSQSDGPVDE
jgi:hypothetical protein